MYVVLYWDWLVGVVIIQCFIGIGWWVWLLLMASCTHVCSVVLGLVGGCGYY